LILAKSEKGTTAKKITPSIHIRCSQKEQLFSAKRVRSLLRQLDVAAAVQVVSALTSQVVVVVVVVVVAVVEEVVLGLAWSAVDVAAAAAAAAAAMGEYRANSGWLVYDLYSSWEHSLAFSLKHRTLS
jgi:Na+/citrate or Na+/malate symporter